MPHVIGQIQVEAQALMGVVAAGVFSVLWWMIQSRIVAIENKIAATEKLPVHEQRLNDHHERIKRLEDRK